MLVAVLIDTHDAGGAAMAQRLAASVLATAHCTTAPDVEAALVEASAPMLLVSFGSEADRAAMLAVLDARPDVRVIDAAATSHDAGAVMSAVGMAAAKLLTGTANSSSSPVAAAAADAVAASPVLLSANARVTAADCTSFTVQPFSSPETATPPCAVGDVVVGFVVCRSKALKLWAHDDAAVPLVLPSGSVALVAAPLGDRESSTHANGGVPAGGLALPPLADAVGALCRELAVATDKAAPPLPAAATAVWDWLAAGGIVGVLEGSADSANPLAQRSTPFIPVGRLMKREGGRGDGGGLRAVTVASLAPPVPSQKQQQQPPAACPVILVTGTSAEAGKSTFASKLIAALTKGGQRVGAVKVTGTGGCQDTRQYRAAGAVCAYDQVNGGLPTTYVAADTFAAVAYAPFQLCDAAGVDIIVAELGGDVIWANNETLLRGTAGTTPDIMGRVAAAFLIANDTLAALGAQRWCEQVMGADAAASLVIPVCCPFRNHAGALRRSAALGLAPPLHPNDTAAVVDAIRARLPNMVFK